MTGQKIADAVLDSWGLDFPTIATLLLQVLIVDSKGDLSLDCCVDANFAGNCCAKEANNPATMRSRSGFIITLSSVPVLWKSVLESEITLSTVEAECITPSTVIRKLIQMQTALFKIKNTFGLKISNNLSKISVRTEQYNSVSLG